MTTLAASADGNVVTDPLCTKCGAAWDAGPERTWMAEYPCWQCGNPPETAGAVAAAAVTTTYGNG